MVPLESLIKKEFITDVSEQRKMEKTHDYVQDVAEIEPMINNHI